MGLVEIQVVPRRNGLVDFMFPINPLQPDAALEAPEKTVKEDEARNVYQRDGVRTQHYTSRRLKLMCEKAGFKFMDCDPVEYEWDTELPEPTNWMGAPYPFDWLVMVQKVMDDQTSSAAIRPAKNKS